MKFFNTLTKSKQAFKPLKKGEVSLYTCGPTVYQSAHIGNLRTYIFEDILRRSLEYNGYKVHQVMNLTDVGHLTSDADTGEDKVEKEARKEGKKASDITKFYTDEFKTDLKRLNIEFPQKFAPATKYIKEQIALIQQIEKKGYTYRIADGIYFDTQKFKHYGRLGKVSTGKARVEHAEGKKHDTDFALWKFSPAGEKRQQEWKSPWGVGFPGWHIECSAISMKELGNTFDIHTGGVDHILIHHNNEIAQSEAATGKPLAKYWLHGEFLLLDKDKMSKSLGNFYTLQSLIDKGADPMAFRLLCISSSYRSRLNFSDKAMIGAENNLQKLRTVFEIKARGGKIIAKYQKEFAAAVADDLNMPKAFVVVWEVVKSAKMPLADKQATLIDFDRVLGLGLKDYKPAGVPSEVAKLITEREQARATKDWKKADLLRTKIEKAGWMVKDTPTGVEVVPAPKK